MVELSIGLGLLFNLLTYELFGLAAGGAVVPGYLALFLDQPVRIGGTFVVAIVTLLAVRWLEGRMLLFGRRKFTVMLLIGFVVNAGFDAVTAMLPGPWLGTATDLRAVGFIVPGLLANEMHGQGVVPTAALTLITAMAVRLIVFAVGRVWWGV